MTAAVWVPIVVGVLTLAGGYIVAKVVKPSDIMSDNTQLRKELRDTDDKVEAIRTEFNNMRDQYNRERDILGRGFDAVSRKLERVVANCGDHQHALPADPVDEEAIKEAKELRNK